MRLAEPITEEFVHSNDDYRTVILLVVVGWDLALLPQDDQEQKLNELVRTFCGRDRDAMVVLRWIVDLVAERKRRYYPWLNHAIHNVSFQPQDDGSDYVEVMYELVPVHVNGDSAGARLKSARSEPAPKPDPDQFSRALARFQRVSLPERALLTAKSVAWFLLCCALFCLLFPVWLVWRIFGGGKTPAE